MDFVGGLINQGITAAVKAAANIMPESLLKALDDERLEVAVDGVAKVIHAMDDKPVLVKRAALAEAVQSLANEHGLDALASTALQGVLNSKLGLHIDL